MCIGHSFLLVSVLLTFGFSFFLNSFFTLSTLFFCFLFLVPLASRCQLNKKQWITPNANLISTLPAVASTHLLSTAIDLANCYTLYTKLYGKCVYFIPNLVSVVTDPYRNSSFSLYGHSNTCIRKRYTIRRGHLVTLTPTLYLRPFLALLYLFKKEERQRVKKRKMSDMYQHIHWPHTFSPFFSASGIKIDSRQFQ